MRTHRFWLSALVTAGAASLALVCLQPATHVAAQSESPSSPEFYTHQVEPIFKENCYRCHAGMNHRGRFQLDTRAALLHGGADGVVVVPGHPEDSLLIKLIRHEGPAKDPMPMPPKSKISDEQIATVTAWIKAGAIMPESDETPAATPVAK